MAELVRVERSVVEEYTIVKNLSKRDTASIDFYAEIDGQKTKRLIVCSSLNQGFTITSSIMKEDGTYGQAGLPKSYASNPGYAISIESDTNLPALNILKGKIKLSIAFSVAPTAGILDVKLQMIGS